MAGDAPLRKPKVTKGKAKPKAPAGDRHYTEPKSRQPAQVKVKAPKDTRSTSKGARVNHENLNRPGDPVVTAKHVTGKDGRRRVEAKKFKTYTSKRGVVVRSTEQAAAHADRLHAKEQERQAVKKQLTTLADKQTTFKSDEDRKTALRKAVKVVRAVTPDSDEPIAKLKRERNELLAEQRKPTTPKTGKAAAEREVMLKRAEPELKPAQRQVSARPELKAQAEKTEVKMVRRALRETAKGHKRPLNAKEKAKFVDKGMHEANKEIVRHNNEKRAPAHKRKLERQGYAGTAGRSLAAGHRAAEKRAATEREQRVNQQLDDTRTRQLTKLGDRRTLDRNSMQALAGELLANGGREIKDFVAGAPASLVSMFRASNQVIPEAMERLGITPDRKTTNKDLHALVKGFEQSAAGELTSAAMHELNSVMLRGGTDMQRKQAEKAHAKAKTDLKQAGVEAYRNPVSTAALLAPGAGVAVRAAVATGKTAKQAFKGQQRISRKAIKQQMREDRAASLVRPPRRVVPKDGPLDPANLNRAQRRQQAKARRRQLQDDARARARGEFRHQLPPAGVTERLERGRYSRSGTIRTFQKAADRIRRQDVTMNGRRWSAAQRIHRHNLRQQNRNVQLGGTLAERRMLAEVDQAMGGRRFGRAPKLDQLGWTAVTIRQLTGATSRAELEQVIRTLEQRIGNGEGFRQSNLRHARELLRDLDRAGDDAIFHNPAVVRTAELLAERGRESESTLARTGYGEQRAFEHTRRSAAGYLLGLIDEDKRWRGENWDGPPQAPEGPPRGPDGEKPPPTPDGKSGSVRVSVAPPTPKVDASKAREKEGEPPSLLDRELQRHEAVRASRVLPDPTADYWRRRSVARRHTEQVIDDLAAVLYREDDPSGERGVDVDEMPGTLGDRTQGDEHALEVLDVDGDDTIGAEATATSWAGAVSTLTEELNRRGVAVPRALERKLAQFFDPELDEDSYLKLREQLASRDDALKSGSRSRQEESQARAAKSLAGALDDRLVTSLDLRQRKDEDQALQEFRDDVGPDVNDEVLGLRLEQLAEELAERRDDEQLKRVRLAQRALARQGDPDPQRAETSREEGYLRLLDAFEEHSGLDGPVERQFAEWMEWIDQYVERFGTYPEGVTDAVIKQLADAIRWSGESGHGPRRAETALADVDRARQQSDHAMLALARALGTNAVNIQRAVESEDAQLLKRRAELEKQIDEGDKADERYDAAGEDQLEALEAELDAIEAEIEHRVRRDPWKATLFAGDGTREGFQKQADAAAREYEALAERLESELEVDGRFDEQLVRQLVAAAQDLERVLKVGRQMKWATDHRMPDKRLTAPHINEAKLLEDVFTVLGAIGKRDAGDLRTDQIVRLGDERFEEALASLAARGVDDETLQRLEDAHQRITATHRMEGMPGKRVDVDEREALLDAIEDLEAQQVGPPEQWDEPELIRAHQLAQLRERMAAQEFRHGKLKLTAQQRFERRQQRELEAFKYRLDAALENVTQQLRTTSDPDALKRLTYQQHFIRQEQQALEQEKRDAKAEGRAVVVPRQTPEAARRREYRALTAWADDLAGLLDEGTRVGATDSELEPIIEQLKELDLKRSEALVALEQVKPSTARQLPNAYLLNRVKADELILVNRQLQALKDAGEQPPLELLARQRALQAETGQKGQLIQLGRYESELPPSARGRRETHPVDAKAAAQAKHRRFAELEKAVGAQLDLMASLRPVLENEAFANVRDREFIAEMYERARTELEDLQAEKEELIGYRPRYAAPINVQTPIEFDADGNRLEDFGPDKETGAIVRKRGSYEPELKESGISRDYVPPAKYKLQATEGVEPMARRLKDRDADVEVSNAEAFTKWAARHQAGKEHVVLSVPAGWKEGAGLKRLEQVIAQLPENVIVLHGGESAGDFMAGRLAKARGLTVVRMATHRDLLTGDWRGKPRVTASDDKHGEQWVDARDARNDELLLTRPRRVVVFAEAKPGGSRRDLAYRARRNTLRTTVVTSDGFYELRPETSARRITLDDVGAGLGGGVVIPETDSLAGESSARHNSLRGVAAMDTPWVPPRWRDPKRQVLASTYVQRRVRRGKSVDPLLLRLFGPRESRTSQVVKRAEDRRKLEQQIQARIEQRRANGQGPAAAGMNITGEQTGEAILPDDFDFNDVRYEEAGGAPPRAGDGGDGGGQGGDPPTPNPGSTPGPGPDGKMTLEDLRAGAIGDRAGFSYPREPDSNDVRFLRENSAGKGFEFPQLMDFDWSSDRVKRGALEREQRTTMRRLAQIVGHHHALTRDGEQLRFATAAAAKQAAPDGYEPMPYEKRGQAEKFVLVPSGVARLVDSYIRPAGRPEQVLQWVTRMGVRATLPFSTLWYAGNVVDMYTRLALTMTPAHARHAKQFADALRTNLAGLNPRLADELLGPIATGHYGSLETVSGPRLATALLGPGRGPALGEGRSPKQQAQQARAERINKLLDPLVRDDELRGANFVSYMTSKAFDVASRIEQGPRMRMSGDEAMRYARELGIMVDDFRAGAKQLAEKLDEHPELLFALQSRVLEVAGDFSTRKAADRAMLLGLDPFWRWFKAANKFVFSTLPERSPMRLALLMQASLWTRDERRKAGLDFYITDDEARRLRVLLDYPDQQDPFLAGAYQQGDGAVATGFMTSFGEAGQLVHEPERIAGRFGGFFGPGLGALTGHYRRIGDQAAALAPGGSKLDDLDLHMDGDEERRRAAALFSEPLLKGARQVRTTLEGGERPARDSVWWAPKSNKYGDLASGLNRTFNPAAARPLERDKLTIEEARQRGESLIGEPTTMIYTDPLTGRKYKVRAR